MTYMQRNVSQAVALQALLPGPAFSVNAYRKWSAVTTIAGPSEELLVKTCYFTTTIFRVA